MSKDFGDCNTLGNGNILGNWYQSAGDVKRWADNDEPVEEIQQ